MPFSPSTIPARCRMTAMPVSCTMQPARAILYDMYPDLTSSPTPQQIAEARAKAKQSMEEAAQVLGGTIKKGMWSRWESGHTPMAPHTFDYYLLRTGQRKL
jgi:DNA-binding transcriptional regulator YiaG